MDGRNPAFDELDGCVIIAPRFTYNVVCRDLYGRWLWEEVIDNLVTTEGKTDIMDQYFGGSSYTAGWYLGLKGVGPGSYGDTLASHSAWSEVTPYSGNRPTVTFNVAAAGVKTASAVTFTMTSSSTVAGAFLASVATGTAGKLYSVADFPSSRAVSSGYIITVTPTVSAV